MYKRRNVLSGMLILLSVISFVAVARGGTVVYLESNAIGGSRETARRLGKVAKLSELAASKDTVIVAGRLDNKHIVPLVKAADLKVDTKWIGKQGFYIKTLKDGKILVTANTHIGVLYGLMEIRDRIAESGRGILKQKLDIKDRPVFEIRGGDAKLRANFVTAWAEEQQKTTSKDSNFFLYTDFPEIFPDAETRREHVRKVMIRRAWLKKKVAEAAAYGAKVYLFIYQPTLPYWAHKPFITAHSEVKPKRQLEYWHPLMCPSAQASKDIFYKKIRNLFRDVPGIGGILLNAGEHCQSVYSCGCDKCEKQKYEDRLVEYVMLMRKAMQESTPDAKVYLRPWGILNHGLKSNPKNFLALADKLPHDVRFWAKVTVPPGGDYLWHDHFNPLIKMPRIETFGWKTCHPNMSIPCPMQLCYIAPKYRARAIKLANLGLKGQTSIRKPNRKESLYEPSVLAANKISWNPYRFDPDKFMLKWANRKFGKDAAPLVADAMKDTYKITSAFTQYYQFHSGWLQVLNFVQGKFTQTYNRSATYPQTEEVENVSLKTINKLLAVVRLAEEIKIAENADRKLGEALALKPRDKVLKRYRMMAKATAALTRFYHNYHTALLYNNLSLNICEAAGGKYHKLAGGHIKAALPDMKTYVEQIHKLHPIYNTYFRDFTGRWRMGEQKRPRNIEYLYGVVASVQQQCNNGYCRLVMEPQRAREYPHILLEAQNHHNKIGHKRRAPHPEEMLWRNLLPKLLRKWKGDEFIYDADENLKTPQSLPAIISPFILPKLRITFRGDLGKGAMLVMRYVPLGGKSRANPPRKSVLKIALDGKNVKSLTDIASGGNLCDNEFIRFVELPPTDGKKHELTLTAPSGCTGTEFYFIRIYTPTDQKLYVESTSPYQGRMGYRLWTEGMGELEEGVRVKKR